MAAGDLTTLANVKAWLNLGQVTDTVQIPAEPGPYVVTVAKAAAWNGEAGVIETVRGNYLIPVAEDPGAGEYTVAAGVYTFNAAQAGLAVSITYTINTPQDALLGRLVGAVSGWVQQYLNRRIASQDYVEVRDGLGGRSLFFANTPVSAVASVLIDGRALPPAVGPLDAGYRFTPNLLKLTGYGFTRGLGNVELTYTAGYENTPPELEQAVIQIVALRYKEREHIGQDAASGQQQNITFSKELPADLKQVLDSWKRVVPV